MIGILMSKMHRSGRSSSASFTAVSPSPASPTDVVALLDEHLAKVEPDQCLVLGDEDPAALPLGHGQPLKMIT